MAIKDMVRPVDNKNFDFISWDNFSKPKKMEVCSEKIIRNWNCAWLLEHSGR